MKYLLKQQDAADKMNKPVTRVFLFISRPGIPSGEYDVTGQDRQNYHIAANGKNVHIPKTNFFVVDSDKSLLDNGDIAEIVSILQDEIPPNF